MSETTLAPDAGEHAPTCVRCAAPLVAFHEPLCVACGERVARALVDAGIQPMREAEALSLLSHALSALVALALGFLAAALGVHVLAGDAAASSLALVAAGLAAAATAALPIVYVVAQRALAPALLRLARDVGPATGTRAFIVVLPAAPASAEDDIPAPPVLSSGKHAPLSTTGVFVVGETAVALYRPVRSGARPRIDDVESAPRASIKIDAVGPGRWVSVSGGTPERPLMLGLDLRPTPGIGVRAALVRALAPGAPAGLDAAATALSPAAPARRPRSQTEPAMPVVSADDAGADPGSGTSSGSDSDSGSGEKT